MYEELVTKDMERARQVYQMCLRLIPHKIFTFAEIWLLYSKFEIRQKDLTAARKALVTIGPSVWGVEGVDLTSFQL